MYCVISFHVMLKEWHDLSCHSWSIWLNIFANNGTWVMISDQNCVFRTDFGQKLYFLCRFWAQIKVIRAARQQWSQYFTLGYYPWYLRLISHLYLKYSTLLIIFKTKLIVFVVFWPIWALKTNFFWPWRRSRDPSCTIASFKNIHQR